VHQGLESCNEATDAELDELDEATGITPKSRLGCQTVPDGTTDIVVKSRMEQKLRQGTRSLILSSRRVYPAMFLGSRCALGV